MSMRLQEISYDETKYLDEMTREELEEMRNSIKTDIKGWKQEIKIVTNKDQAIKLYDWIKQAKNDLQEVESELL